MYSMHTVFVGLLYYRSTSTWKLYADMSTVYSIQYTLSSESHTYRVYTHIPYPISNIWIHIVNCTYLCTRPISHSCYSFHGQGNCRGSIFDLSIGHSFVPIIIYASYYYYHTAYSIQGTSRLLYTSSLVISSRVAQLSSAHSTAQLITSRHTRDSCLSIPLVRLPMRR